MKNIYEEKISKDIVEYLAENGIKSMDAYYGNIVRDESEYLDMPTKENHVIKVQNFCVDTGEEWGEPYFITDNHIERMLLTDAILSGVA